MRVDTAGPRTWLLAGAAVWALAVWVLALAGMGGNIATLDDDAALAKPLPAPRASTANRIGALPLYAEIGERPLFSTDRRPRPFYLQGNGEETAKAFDYVLTSVLITPMVKLAILQPPDGSQSLRVKLGEAPEPQPAWRLTAVNERSAVFEGPEGQRTLELRVFDGQGGQAPTSITGAPGRTAPAPVATADEKPGPQGPVEEDPGSKQVAAPATTAKPAVTPPAPMTADAQMEAIRRRIQARRDQLRRESQQKQPPARNP